MALNITHLSQSLWLDSSGALFWENGDMLLLADLHLGKVTHFRKNGLAVPGQAAGRDLRRIAEVVDLYSPGSVVFLGDLFHSTLNAEWDDFTRLLATYSHTPFTLVRGNHDMLPTEIYTRAGMQVVPHLAIDPFRLTHHPDAEPTGEGYNLAGHVHPSIRLKGAGRQRLKLPCFIFGPRGGLIPAFGKFTGTHVIAPEDQDRIFVMSDNTVIEV